MSIEARVFNSIAEVRSQLNINKTFSEEKPTRNPFNEYNLFFILERQRLLKLKDPNYERNMTASQTSQKAGRRSCHGYENITLPLFPPRYQGLILSDDWFVPGNRKKSQRKNQGIVTFQELSKNASKEWKSLDKVTKAYLKDVADILRDRHMENIVRSRYCTPMEAFRPENAIVTPPALPSPQPPQSPEPSMPVLSQIKVSTNSQRFSFSILMDEDTLDLLTTSLNRLPRIGDVGMSDYEIMNIWNSA